MRSRWQPRWANTSGTLALVTLVGALLAPRPALAGVPAGGTGPAVHRRAGSGAGGLRRLGAMLDVGVPDAVGMSLVGRPLRWLRLHLGGNCNLVSGGIRGGVTLVPFHAVVSPSLTLEGGYTFEGDANWLTGKLGFRSAVLERIGYGYGSAHLGLEIGSPNRVLFFVHGGVSYVVARIHSLQHVLQSETGDPSIQFEDPNVKIFAPSAKVGFVLYL